MKNLLAGTRYLALIAVAFALVAALAALGWGALKAIAVVRLLVTGAPSGVTVGLIQVMDSFLVAAALMIFGFGIYELFIGDLGLPPALTVHGIDQLKDRLAAIVVLVLSVLFLERAETGESLAVLEFGGAVALVGAMLIAFARGRRN